MALYRRRLFSLGLGPSCFALPELAVLGSVESPQGIRQELKTSLAALAGDFVSAPAATGPGLTTSSQGYLYLGLGPSLTCLRESLTSHLGPSPPFEALGIFLALGPMGHQGIPSLPPPPAVSFHSADLVLLSVSRPDPRWTSLRWTEILSLHRQRALAGKARTTKHMRGL